MEFEKKLWLRLAILFVVLILATSLQLASMTPLIDGAEGERDALKRRISYWATGCTTAYSLTIFLLGRWFTKDLYWRLRTTTNAWAITPSITSVLLMQDIGGILAISMLFIFLISIILNAWLTGMSNILPFSTLGPDAQYNVSTFNFTDADPALGSSSGNVFRGFVSQTSMGYLGKIQLSYYNNSYFWMPFYNSEIPSTILVENVPSFSVQPTCQSLNPSQFNITVDTQYPRFFNVSVSSCVFPINSPRSVANYWSMCAPVEEYNQFTSFSTYTVQTRPKSSLGEPSNITSSGTSLYVSKCDFLIRQWDVTAYISSYGSTRAQILSASPTKNTPFPFQMAYWTMSCLGYFGQTTIDNDGSNNIQSPLWQYMVGWTGVVNATDSAKWVEDRLISILGASITTSTVAKFNYTVTGKIGLDISKIQVTRAGILGGISLQIALVVIVVLMYIFGGNGEYHSDNIKYLLESHTRDDKELQSLYKEDYADDNK